MVLANAIYFMSKWASEFDKNATKQEDFTLADGKSTSVCMMNKSSQLMVTPAYRYDGIQGPAPDTAITYYSARMLRLYFKDNAYCMDVVLPRKGINCDDYLADFDMDDLNWLQNKLSNYSVQVKLPKFTIKYHRDLEEDMSALGMTDVLNPALADLSGITDEEELFLKKLFQDSYIAIEEEGVKAAAVTVGIVAPNAAEPTPSVEPFIVDRPFLLFIREAKYGTILFAAKIGNPSK
jgi:serpin B